MGLGTTIGTDCTGGAEILGGDLDKHCLARLGGLFMEGELDKRHESSVCLFSSKDRRLSNSEVTWRNLSSKDVMIWSW